MRRAFTIVELLVVIIIIGILLSIVMPVLGSVRSTARTVACQANLRSLGQAIAMYLDANRDQLPIALYQASVNTTYTEPYSTLAIFLDHPLPSPGYEVDSFDPWRCRSDPFLYKATGFSYNYAPRDAFSVVPPQIAQRLWRKPTLTIFLDAGDWHPNNRNHVRRDGAVGNFSGGFNGRNQ